MDNLITSVFGPLAVAALTGLTYIAYKHPEEYKTLQKVILWGTKSYFAFVIGWLSAIGIGYYQIELRNIVDKDSLKAIEATLLGLTPAPLLHVSVLVLQFYSIFLGSFTWWLLKKG
jgi:hypothetical protein